MQVEKRKGVVEKRMMGEAVKEKEGGSKNRRGGEAVVVEQRERR